MKNNQKEYPIFSYAQTEDYTCGAACLITALSEFGIGALSKEHEMEVWDSAHPPFYDGCLPALLAKYARAKGCRCRLFVNSKRIKSKLKTVPFWIKVFYRYLLMIEKWHEFKIPTSPCKDIYQVMEQFYLFKDSRLLFVIQVEDYDLHYLLVRLKLDQMWLMDPSDGENRVITLDQINREYDDVGYYLFIHPMERK